MDEDGSEIKVLAPPEGVVVSWDQVERFRFSSIVVKESLGMRRPHEGITDAVEEKNRHPASTSCLDRVDVEDIKTCAFSDHVTDDPQAQPDKEVDHHQLAASSGLFHRIPDQVQGQRLQI